MKEYPHINHYSKGIFGEKIHAFNKLDGSNIRILWDKKNAKKSSFTGGFIRFGTRTQIISRIDQHFGDSVDLFLNKYGDDVNQIFFDNKYFRNINRVYLFCEYFGPNSFAGFHDLNDKKDIVLFDVAPDRKGILPPKDFIEMFGHLNIPELIYEGNYNQELIYNIQHGDLKEGVVCKGVRKTKGNDIVWMTKIKTISWLDKLKNKYGEEKLKEELL